MSCRLSVGSLRRAPERPRVAAIRARTVAPGPWSGSAAGPGRAPGDRPASSARPGRERHPRHAGAPAASRGGGAADAEPGADPAAAGDAARRDREPESGSCGCRAIPARVRRRAPGRRAPPEAAAWMSLPAARAGAGARGARTRLASRRAVDRAEGQQRHQRERAHGQHAVQHHHRDREVLLGGDLPAGEHLGGRSQLSSVARSTPSRRRCQIVNDVVPNAATTTRRPTETWARNLRLSAR